MWAKLHQEDRIKLIREGLKAGMSTSQIANWIGGTTRNSIIGYVHRHKLGSTGPSSLQKKSADQAPRKRKKQAPVVAEVGERPAPAARRDPVPPRLRLPVIKPAAALLAPMNRKVRLEDLKSGDCRYPLGDPFEADFGFCGGPRKGESPYCHHHHRCCYVPPELVRKAK